MYVILDGLSFLFSTHHLLLCGNVGARSSGFWVEGGQALSPLQAKAYDDDQDDHKDNTSNDNARDDRSRESAVAPVVGDEGGGPFVETVEDIQVGYQDLPLEAIGAN